MHKLHAGLTIAVPVKNGQERSLKEALLKVKPNLEPALKKTASILFFSGVVIPAQRYKKENDLPATFILTTSYSGSRKKHLQELTDLKCILSPLFLHCDKYTENEFCQYLRKYSYRSNFTSRYHCIDKKDVEKEKMLRIKIGDYLDRAQSINAFEGVTATGVKKLIERHLLISPEDYEWIKERSTPAWWEYITINKYNILQYAGIAAALLVSALFPTTVARYFLWILLGVVCTLALYFLLGAYIFRKKSAPAPERCDKELRAQAATQLGPVLNEMIAVAPLKSGHLRRIFFTAVLLYLRTVRFPVQVPTVSTIRWLLIDKRRRLVFLSNYANTTDFYVREFLNGKTTRESVNFMFSNGEGFPDTKWHMKGGIITDPTGYMNAVHHGQQVTQCWYAHDPYLTVDIICRNRQIRQGLFKRMDEDEAAQWLKLL